MSTFGGLINEIEGISVDRFDEKNLESRAYFLSHCHSDHMKGIDNDVFYTHLKSHGYSIFTSEISSIILKNRWKYLSDHIKVLNIGETHTIVVPKSINGEETYLSVTLIPAGHCPGSVMFLFSTPNRSNILYTGDFRLNPKDLPKMKQFHCRDGDPIIIDKMYFDSTFFDTNFSYFPNREDSSAIICRLIKEWITQGNEYVVNLNIPAYYGSEFVYMDISRKLGMPFHVHKDVYNSYRQIAEMEGIFTQDAKITQIHSCTPGGAMREITCRSVHNLKIRQIKPSALRWRNLKITKPAFSENYGNFYVCYSSHCSYTELKGFIRYLKPKAIEPCVVPEAQLEIFHEFVNTFFKKYLNLPCRMRGSVLSDSNQEVVVLNSHKSLEKNLVKINSKNIIVYPDSDEEPPKKSSRLTAIQQSMLT